MQGWHTVPGLKFLVWKLRDTFPFFKKKQDINSQSSIYWYYFLITILLKNKPCLITTILYKQGFYNYKYIAVNQERKIIHGEISGNFDETENEYNVIVYYRNYGERYDRVVGVGKGLSQFITN